MRFHAVVANLAVINHSDIHVLERRPTRRSLGICVHKDYRSIRSLGRPGDF